ncbi:MAG: hypothetical protein K2M06_04155 [Muribaculaceae bacterium]|nr:hypothetical protein [Muribaculaceae bacterium]
METNTPEIKYLLSAFGGWLWAMYAPVFPYAGVCTFLVVLAALTALRRMWRKGERTGLRVLAQATGRLVGRLTRMNVALLTAHLVQMVVLEGTGLLSSNLLSLTAALICFRQILTILENEGSAPGAAWARDLLEKLRKRD